MVMCNVNVYLRQRADNTYNLIIFSGSFRYYNGFILSMLCIEPYMDSSINKILRNVSNDERAYEKIAYIGANGSSNR